VHATTYRHEDCDQCVTVIAFLDLCFVSRVDSDCRWVVWA